MPDDHLDRLTYAAQNWLLFEDTAPADDEVLLRERIERMKAMSPQQRRTMWRLYDQTWIGTWDALEMVAKDLGQDPESAEA
ncbi:hypothetical protein SAMN05660748_0529 [Blastococcus aggregatus]|uniref:Uncharacterized protein n=1 Tax=Blastococcus aggregatus TaxID=38502 RepID=A0A285UYN0_9ACTN|nr:hypothetical protein [Blastococcus aggregatus]SOC46929.1 hypothetical protein SAMN05660748_0529 [Blastococcus aggregatus]